MNLEKATSDFVLHCKYEKNLSEKTIKFYQIDLHQFEQFLVVNSIDLAANEITKEILRLYLQCLSSFKAKTIKRKIATLKVFFNYLEFEDRIVVSPFRKMKIKIREPKVLPKVMSLIEIENIFKSAYEARSKKTDKNEYSYFEKVRDIAVLEILFATGVRVSELVNLKVNDIDLKSGNIKVNGKGNKERIMQICNKEVLELLLEYDNCLNKNINEVEEYFFVNRFNKKLSDQSVRGVVKKYSKIACIKRNITPHVFRHTFATLLLEKDVDIKYIQSFLGHSSISTTQIYTHVNREKQKRILEYKHPRGDFSMS